jgi:alkylhydroperoxidase/carboxymuconolactone decarboxylase family protein YurZ
MQLNLYYFGMAEQRRISIALEKISTPKAREELAEFVTHRNAEGNFPNAAYFSLKLAAGMFLNTGETDGMIEPYRNEPGLNVPFIADISVSGGYEAGYKLATEATRKLGITNPTYVLAAGLPVDGVRAFKSHLDSEGLKASIMTTGALPENNPDDFEIEFNSDPYTYTKMKVLQAQELGLAGVYAAARYGSVDCMLGLSAGVSLDGSSYRSDGVVRDATALENTFLISQQALLGSVLMNSPDLTEYLCAAVNIVDKINNDTIG